jgi:carboxypeptidase Q
MKLKYSTLALGLVLSTSLFAQKDNPTVQALIKEATTNSQLETLAHEITDVLGPRLVGTPQMQAANDWAVAQYKSWGIEAKNEKYGEWRGWERGISHIDMLEPRVQSLRGTQLAWNPSTSKEGVTAEVITLPTVKNAKDFEKWLKNVKGKIVLLSMPQITGRPDYNWEEFATEKSFAKMKRQRDSLSNLWNDNIQRTGFTNRGLPEALENAGAVGIVTSNW